MVLLIYQRHIIFSILQNAVNVGVGITKNGGPEESSLLNTHTHTHLIQNTWFGEVSHSDDSTLAPNQRQLSIFQCPHAPGWKQSGADCHKQMKGSSCLWEWLPSSGNAYFCQKCSLHMYVYQRLYYLKSQGRSNSSNEQYFGKDYSLPHEFSYHLNTSFLVVLNTFFVLCICLISIGLVTHF